MQRHFSRSGPVREMDQNMGMPQLDHPWECCHALVEQFGTESHRGMTWKLIDRS